MFSKGNTLIIAKSGSGKSELIKSLWNSQKDGGFTIDPHGDLANELCQIPDKKVYRIAPKERRFVVNPFDIQDKSLEMRELVAQEITEMIKEMIRDTGLSSLMQNIAYPIICTLLRLPYADFKMFSDCCDPENGKRYLEAIRHLVDPINESLYSKLLGDTYDIQKQSIYNRLQGFLTKSLIYKSICGRDDFESLLDLQNGMREPNSRIAICIPIPEIGEDVAVTLGRFYMTRLIIWGKRRESVPKEKRTPVFVFVDEFQNFIGEVTAKGLDQFTRKYKVLMFLANQHIQQLENREVRGSVMSVANKIVGVSNAETRQIMAKDMMIDPDELAKLKTGFFYARLGTAEAFPLYARMVKSDRTIKPVYCQSQNGNEVLNGWDGVDVEQSHYQEPARRTRSNNSYTRHDQAQETPPEPKQPKPTRRKYTPESDI
jgi:hypothetical protein